MASDEFRPFGDTAGEASDDFAKQTAGLVDAQGLLAGRYRLLSRLGKGGMGEVFLGIHETIQKQVAIKILLEERARQEVQKQRFLTEARATARIRHPNVVDISDFGETPNGRAFFVMEYLEGEDLKQLLRRHHILPWSEIAPILLQACAGLSAAHAHGIVHRDLKPDNIYLIEQQGVQNFVKILDFGLAKMLHEPTTKKLTKTGIIVGTPAFIAPEQIKGDAVDHRVDIYALGLILYRMLCGRLPFRAKTVVEMLRRHMKDEPAPPSEYAPDAPIPPEAEAVALRCLAKEPVGRFASAEDLAQAIAAVGTGNSSSRGRSTGMRFETRRLSSGPLDPALRREGGADRPTPNNAKGGGGRPPEESAAAREASHQHQELPSKLDRRARLEVKASASELARGDGTAQVRVPFGAAGAKSARRAGGRSFALLLGFGAGALLALAGLLWALLR